MFAIFDIPPPDPVRYPLTTSVWPITLILAGYLLFVLKLGLIYMEQRKPYDVKNWMIAYNLSQVLFNAVFFIVTLYYLIINPILDLRCMEPFPVDHPRKNLERIVHYAYYLNKLSDLMDTVFFVLRKSYRQISFLHVYHHMLMAGGCYLVIRFYGTGGHFNMLGMINSLVHTVMYFYYFLSVLNPGVKRSIWWKKYITITQLIQFTVLLAYALYVLVFNPSCTIPRFLIYIQLIQGVIMIYMFGKFYLDSYVRPPRPKQT